MKFQKGFTLIELLMVVGVVAIIGFVLVSSFLKFKDNQGLAKDSDTVVAMLESARNLSINSKNASVYGVHFTNTTITLFTGSAYTSATTTNKVYSLNGDNVLTVSLVGGGNDVIFKRLSGETSQSGTITISSPRLVTTKTVTIYKTGIFESN